MKSLRPIKLICIKAVYFFEAVFFKKNGFCPYCGSASHDLIFKKFAVVDICRCRNCALLWTNPIFKFPRAYDLLYTENDLVTNIPDNKRLKQLIQDDFRNTEKDYYGVFRYFIDRHAIKRALEFGCSWGYFLKQLSRQGVEAVGVEISDKRREFGRNVLGLRIESDLKGLCGDNESFDAIFCIHVLEHLSDISAIFKSFRSLLKPGGVLFLEVPDMAPEKMAPGFKWMGAMHPLGFTAEFFKRNLGPEGFEFEIHNGFFDLIGCPKGQHSDLVVVGFKKEKG